MRLQNLEHNVWTMRSRVINTIEDYRSVHTFIINVHPTVPANVYCTFIAVIAGNALDKEIFIIHGW